MALPSPSKVNFAAMPSLRRLKSGKVHPLSLLEWIAALAFSGASTSSVVFHVFKRPPPFLLPHRNMRSPCLKFVNARAIPLTTCCESPLSGRPARRHRSNWNGTQRVSNTHSTLSVNFESSPPQDCKRNGGRFTLESLVSHIEENAKVTEKSL